MKYFFRGQVVFDYNEETDELTTGMVDGTNIPAINFCKYIDEDFILMERFFKNINDYKLGKITTLEDIEVD